MGFIITFENKNTMISTPKEELTTRLQKVQQVIIEQQADACIITSSVNQFYLNDFIFDGYLYILPESDPFLFIKRPIGIKGHRVAYIRKPEQIPDMLNHYNLPLPGVCFGSRHFVVYLSHSFANGIKHADNCQYFTKIARNARYQIRL